MKKIFKIAVPMVMLFFMVLLPAKNVRAEEVLAENTVLYRHQWVQVGNEWHYYDDNGQRCLGWTEIDGELRYITEQGAVINNFIYLDGKWYYFDGDGVSVRNQWLAFDNGETWVWFDDSGARCLGWTEIDGKLRYITEKGAVINDFIYLNGKWYYFDSDGVSVRNQWLAFDNGETWVWFDKTGARCFGWTEIDGKMRYITEKGAVINNFIFENGKWYYFDSDGVSVRNQWLAFDNGKSWAWFDKTGARCLGWTEIDGKLRYIDEKGAYVNCWKIINGKEYYFDADGENPRNEWRYLGGYKLYFGDDGLVMQDVDALIGKQSKYLVKVNTYTNMVNVYAKDGANGYIIPVKSMICSTGLASTPTIKGTFTIKRYGRWSSLMGGVWGQYCSQIHGGYLFHSAWFYERGNVKSLSISEYNKLGNNASHGCVRMTVEDAKWIYDNCNGSTVVVYSSPDGGPLAKPSRPTPVRVSGDRGYDPTDPAFK